MTTQDPSAMVGSDEIERQIGRAAEAIIRGRAEGTLSREEADERGAVHVRVADIARAAVKLYGSATFDS